MSPDNKSTNNDLRHRAEERLKALDSEVGGQRSEIRDQELVVDAQHILNELQDHQVELDMQNEELQAAQTESAAAIARYTALYDFAPVGYFTLTCHGEILQTNLAGSTLLDATRSTLKDKRLGAFIAEADRPAFNAFLKQVFARQLDPTCEVRLAGKKGRIIVVQVGAKLATDGQECHAAVTDITGLKKSEEAMARTAREWGVTFNASNDGIWLLDEEHRIVRSNQQADRLFPSSVGDEAIRCWQVVHGTAGPIADCPVMRAKESLQRETMELQIGDLWYLVTADPILDANGHYAGAVHVVSDITEGKQAEEFLRLKNHVFDASIAANSIADLNGNLTEVNAAFLQLWGYRDREEIIGRPVSDFLCNMDEATAILTAISTAGAWEGEYMAERRDGSTFFAHGSGTVLHDRNGVLIGYQSSVEDITERKQAEATLARQVELLNETQQLTHVGGWEWDVAGQLMTWSDELCRIHGFSPDEFAPGDPKCIDRSLECYDPADRPAIRKAFERCVADGQSYDLEFPFTAVDGVRKWIRTIGRAVWEKDRVVRIFGNVLDITEQRETENQLRQVEKLESIGQLAGGVAHEFNNKLQVILGHTEMALPNVPPEDRLHNDLIEIQQAALHSATLARQLLTFARKQIITPEVLNLNATVEDLLKMLRKLIGEPINLVWQPKASLWFVKMDPSQLQQILTNLCINARDAMDGTGEILIKMANVTLDQVPCAETCLPGEYVQLSFSDDGCGMDEETLNHLFEPFFTTKEIHEGAGLGSAALYGIVQQNHGFITVESALGKGTTFQIYLPRSAAPAAEAEDKTPNPSGDGPETILIVDDDPALLNVWQEILEVLGYTVLAANRPDQALALAEEHSGKIDLLLTDVMMPSMNGQDLAKQLQGLRPDLKCLFMSGYTNEILACGYVQAQDIPFLQKPFSIVELKDKLRSLLAESSSEDPGTAQA